MATPPPDIAAKLALLRQQAAERVKQDAEYRQQADRQYTPVLQPNPNWMPKKADGGTMNQDAMQLALMKKGGLSRFLKGSKETKKLYHATFGNIKKFDSNAPKLTDQDTGAHFFTPDLDFANKHIEGAESGQYNSGANIMPVVVHTKNPWDYGNSKHVDALHQALVAHPQLGEEFAPSRGRLASGDWSAIEDPAVQEAIKKLGHDAFYAEEGGIKNIGVYNRRNIKSIHGNRGTYDRRSPGITKADGGSVPANKRMIDDVYSQYPVHPFNPNQRAMVEGEGEDQTLGTFELKPSMSARDAVELDWLSAYPHKQGVGSRTLKKLQEHAAEHGVGMTLFPWEHGGVSQAKLMKFYKKHGFMPTVKGGKAMIWRPEQKSNGGVTHAHHLEIEERPL
jgi:GNAT superfamily N-acetyltransferase